MRSIDATLDVVHLSDFNPSLSQTSTPDWLLMRTAASAGFDALVTRDFAQSKQLLEMYVLSRLRGFVVVTWRKQIGDAITEWGQLLAYLPLIKKKLLDPAYSGSPGQIILLPNPTLGSGNFITPRDTIGRYATDHGISHKQALTEATLEIEEWLKLAGFGAEDFADIL